MGSNEFRVQIHQNGIDTIHKVYIDPSFVKSLGLEKVHPELIVKESFKFLLTKEPACSILKEFSLEDISFYFDDYFDKIKTLL